MKIICTLLFAILIIPADEIMADNRDELLNQVGGSMVAAILNAQMEACQLVQIDAAGRTRVIEDNKCMKKVEAARKEIDDMCSKAESSSTACRSYYSAAN